MTAGFVVVPAGPVLLGGARDVPPELDEVLAASDRALSAALRHRDEVVIEAAPDVFRDRVPHPRASAGAGCTGWQVVDHLLDRVGFRGVRVRVHPGALRPAEITVFAADGSASVGVKSPRPHRDGARWDALIDDAIRTGRGEVLRELDDTAAAAVGCTTAAVWRSLGSRVTPQDRVRECRSWAPFGVTYWVASWENDSGHPEDPGAR